MPRDAISFDVKKITREEREGACFLVIIRSSSSSPSSCLHVQPFSWLVCYCRENGRVLEILELPEDKRTCIMGHVLPDMHSG